MIGFLQLFLLLLLAATSVWLAAVEASFYLLKRRRLAHVALQNPRAELVNRYVEDPPALLMPIHIGTYVAHVGMTILLTAVFLEQLEHWAMLLAFGAMVLYLLLVRLVLPYSIVRRNPERTLLMLMPVFHAYARALSPLVSALRKRAALEPHEGDQTGTVTARHDVPPPPVHDEDEARLVDSLARFSETQVREIMTPRPDVVALPAEAPVAELRALMRETKYSRIPVYGKDLDDIVGVVEVRDLVAYDGDYSAPVRPLARPVHLVPETKRIAELLRELQSQRTTFAVVIDEYGGMAGLVSVEDIVEELVGEIKDEYDVETEPMAIAPDGTLLASGRGSLERLEQALEASLCDPDVEVDTVGGLVTMAFGRIPRRGESIEYRGFLFEVVEAERKRVSQVRVRRLPPEEEPS